jgi:putative spermidine/putrescine transport system ATP-binding protein
MDEPLGALDKKLREQMQREIKRVHRERRISVLYVTHDQEEALTMSDRIAVFNRGRIEQIGTPSELYERPATRFVADFLGDTNFFPGRVLGWAGDHCHVEVGGRRAEAMSPKPVAEGAEVVVAVRPERVRLQGAGERADGLTGRLTEVIYLGASRRAVVRLPDGGDYFALQPAGEAEAAGPSTGEAVSLTWDRRHATVFPA